jgi:hypothetical protein
MAPIDMLLSGVKWHVNEWPDGPPAELHAVRSGVLELLGSRLRCHVLSDGTRVFDAEDVARFLGYNAEDAEC